MVQNILSRSKVNLLAHKIKNSIALGGTAGGIRFVLNRYIGPLLYPRYRVLRLERASLISVNMELRSDFNVEPYREAGQLPTNLIEEIDRLITYSNIKTILNNFTPANVLWISSFDGKTCGYCWSGPLPHSIIKHEVPGACYLYDAEVFLPFRNKGLGAQMIGAITRKLFEDTACSSIWAKVHVLNRSSLGMFRKCGFEIVVFNKTGARNKTPTEKE